MPGAGPSAPRVATRPGSDSRDAVRSPRRLGLMPKKGLLERLQEGVVLGDGGYILELERRGYVQAGPYTPEVAVEHPDALRQLHREFLRAGAEVLQALTFYASRDKLGTAGDADAGEGVDRAAAGTATEGAANEAGCQE